MLYKDSDQKDIHAYCLEGQKAEHKEIQTEASDLCVCLWLCVCF